MINVKHEGEYNADLNIVYLKFINKPQSFEDIDYIVNKNEEFYKKGGKNKVWNITDISEMGMASVKFVSYYDKIGKPLVEKYLIDYCAICSKPLERIAAQLYNILMKEKHPIFNTREEAESWVLKEQESRGRFIPL